MKYEQKSLYKVFFGSTDCLIYPNCPKNNDNQKPKDEREGCNGQSCHWEHVFGKSMLDHEIPVHTFKYILSTSLYGEKKRKENRQRGVRPQYSPKTGLKKKKKTVENRTTHLKTICITPPPGSLSPTAEHISSFSPPALGSRKNSELQNQ